MIGKYVIGETVVKYNNGSRIMNGIIVADDIFHVVIDFGFTLVKYCNEDIYNINGEYWYVD